jgi:hypothetical protein
MCTNTAVIRTTKEQLEKKTKGQVTREKRPRPWKGGTKSQSRDVITTADYWLWGVFCALVPSTANICQVTDEQMNK